MDGGYKVHHFSAALFYEHPPTVQMRAGEVLYHRASTWVSGRAAMHGIRGVLAFFPVHRSNYISGSQQQCPYLTNLQKLNGFRYMSQISYFCHPLKENQRIKMRIER